ncbi:hypothetical protein T484DRAFT_1815137 [Baffinella frigidus]|nr:hypothetical protein T484DRAFT_1815137 [Cryptophyta sp. CCMP2293]
MSGSIGDSFKALAGPQVLALAIGVVVTGVVGRIIALKLALRVAYKGNKTALMVLKLLSGKSPRLYAFQDYLPNLPLPRLKDSLRKWLESVQPLVSDEDFKKAQVPSNPLLYTFAGATGSCA